MSFCLLSNNWHADVYRFAGELEMPIVAKALKPLPPAFLAARRKIGGAAADTVVVGDQLATDVLGAHLTGMKAYMLQPLVEQDLPHTLLLRNVERAILGDRKPEPAINIAECEACLLYTSILARAEEEPAVIAGLDRLTAYYLPTTVKLLDAYDRLEEEPIPVSYTHLSSTTWSATCPIMLMRSSPGATTCMPATPRCSRTKR